MRFWRILTLLLVVAVAGINLWRTGLEAFHWPRPPVASPGFAPAVSSLFAAGFGCLGGILLTALLWPRRGETALVVYLGAGLGLGLTSLVYHFASLLTAQPLLLAFPLELVSSCSLLFLWLRKMRAVSPPPAATQAARSWLGSVVFGVFGAGCAVALYSLTVTWRSVPAELCGANLPGGLPLVAAAVARITAYTGPVTPWAAGLSSGIYSLATLGLLVAGVQRLRNRLIALTGGLVLLGTPFFSRFTSVEHADVPFGFFLLAATVLLSLARDEDDRGMLFLAGLAAGFSAWTKAEGLYFCAALTLVHTVAQLAAKHPRNLPPLLGGLALALVPLVWFKLALAPAGGSPAGLAALADGSRHSLILQAGWRDLRHFGEWYSLPFFVMVLPLLGPWRSWLERRTLGAIALPPLLLGSSYAAWLVGPTALTEHLAETLSRLLMQVWPAAIFGWCLLAVRATTPAGQTSPAAAPADSPPSGRSA